jgi:hypothetical protein
MTQRPGPERVFLQCGTLGPGQRRNTLEITSMPLRGSAAAELRRLAEELLRDADEFDHIRRREATSHSAWVHGRRIAVRAVRHLITAESAGAGILGGFAPGAGVFAPIEQSDTDRLYWYWRFTVTQLLRQRLPDAFAADAGAYDFPRVKTNAKGQVLGHDGRPIRPIILDRNGRRVRGRLVGKDGLPNPKLLNRGYTVRMTEAARVTDDYGEVQWLSHTRAQLNDWADACRAAHRLLLAHAGELADDAPPTDPTPPAATATPWNGVRDLTQRHLWLLGALWNAAAGRPKDGWVKRADVIIAVYGGKAARYRDAGKAILNLKMAVNEILSAARVSWVIEAHNKHGWRLRKT